MNKSKCQSSKVLIFSYLFLFFFIPHSVTAKELPNHAYPRVANLFYRWDIKFSEVSELSKWDILLVDMEAQTFSPESLRAIRKENPNILILAYITPQEIRRDAGELNGTLRQKLYKKISNYEWLVNDRSGKVFWWPGTWMINITDLGTPLAVKQWKNTLTDFLADEVLSSGLWDGVFYDNVWDNLTWIGDKDIDLNRDSRAEEPAKLNRLWQNGMMDLLDISRKRFGNGILIFGNGGFSYYSQLNGAVFENFPRAQGWNETLGRYSFFIKNARKPSFAILNGNTGNRGRPTDNKQAKNVLSAALLDDGYVSFDNGDQSHAEIWWEDIYDFQLGAPLSEARVFDGSKSWLGSPAVFRRDFKNGLAVVNSAKTKKTIQFPEGAVEFISKEPGRERIVSEITLPPESGELFSRPVESVSSVVLSNGTFVRVFKANGAEAQNGFFNFIEKAKPGAEIFNGDVDRDGRDELVSAAEGIITIQRVGRTDIFAPYGERYKGGLHIAVGDVTGDGVPEIVTGAGEGGGPHVRVFSSKGKLLSSGFMAYNPYFRGGVDVAIADLDRDGMGEIITGAGPGGGPHVRVFNQEGKLLWNGFMAFGHEFLGGVRVALGDVNGDGKDEIITGAASQKPWMKIFTADGKELSDFFAFSPRGQGLDVAVKDITGDNIGEILASSFALVR